MNYRTCVSAITLLAVIAFSAQAADVAQTKKQVVDKGLKYLIERGQDEDGGFSTHAGIGVTALATKAMLKSGMSPDDPAVAKSLAYLKKHIQKDGGIYQPTMLFRNYETCIAMGCFAAANKDGRYDDLLKGAKDYVTGLQWDETEGKTKSDLDYGGAGYGKHQRPDMSNTSYMIDALKECGVGPEDEAMKKALIFISRCQNLETEHNTTEFASKNPDGGFYYTCAAGGETKVEGDLPNGGLRSYASMTYAGLKSMIYAGVGPDDPRVKAAVRWATKNYGLNENPGMGNSGLYYYYHTFAKALAATGLDEIEDADGVKHDWRQELIEELARRQQKDGSWINEDDRWMEADPSLVTGYALLALSYCRKDVKE